MVYPSDLSDAQWDLIKHPFDIRYRKLWKKR